ncbi:hypothetical protein NMG60_11017436 [Bertholletia excelsa]
MESMNLELVIDSAKDLKEVGRIYKTRVYAKLEFGNIRRETLPDDRGKTNPTWKYPTSFIVRNEEVADDKTTVTIKLYGKRPLFKDKYLGKVPVSLKDIYRKGNRPGTKILSYKVKDGQGFLTISYEFIGCQTKGTGADDYLPSWVCPLCGACFQVIKCFFC